MAYRLAGTWLASCSCKMVCPCNFGPATPDQEWCSAAIALNISEGRSDDLDLSGTRVVFIADLPGDFVGGNATARLYIDDSASQEQQSELESILMGRRGGVWEAVAAGIVSEWLPTKSAPITVSDDQQSINVSGAGQIRLAPIATETGQRTMLVNAPAAAMWNFAGGGTNLAHAQGSEWSDPEMRLWKSLGFGEIAEFDWSA